MVHDISPTLTSNHLVYLHAVNVVTCVPGNLVLYFLCVKSCFGTITHELVRKISQMFDT